MQLEDLLEHLRRACTRPDSSRTEVRQALENLLVWLNEPSHNTDENCRKVDYYVTLQVNAAERNKLPEDIEGILFDMGGALHDTHTAPDVAENFESTPKQLLERVRRL